MRFKIDKLCCLIVLLILTSCATRETAFIPQETTKIDQPFSVQGRLAVRWQGKGYSVGFSWQHQLQYDEIVLYSPLGNTVAQVIKHPREVMVKADGKIWQANDVESLTEKTLGWPLPLAGLVWWIRGWPQPEQPYTRNTTGQLEQLGWQIRFVWDSNSEHHYPKRVEMKRSDLTVKILMQAWD